MKCPNCGNETFVAVQLHDVCILYGYGNVEQVVIAYACEKCGRVELYMPKKWVQDNIDAKKLAKAEKEFYAEKEERISCLKKRIEQLKPVIDDENQTVKAVKEAQRKIIELENELSSVQRSTFPKK